jgi:outer membrane immunogenic protein
MNKICTFAVAAAASLAISSHSSAADLPNAPTYKAPVAVAAVYNWTGFYVGGNAGYGWGNQDPLELFSNRFDRQSINISGGMIGGTVGAQIQQGYVVLGLEGDLAWADIAGSSVIRPSILGIGQGITLNTTSKISAFGTARARVGVAMNNVLLYATGGGALVKSSTNASTIAGVSCGTLGVLPDCGGSSWRPGISAGLGVEWGFTPNWSLKAEYLYTTVVSGGLSIDKFNTVRGGINYRF